MSAEVIVSIALPAVGGFFLAVKYIFRGELARFWLKLQGDDGFLPRREAKDLERRVEVLEDSRR